MEKVFVNLGENSYDIVIGDILENIGKYIKNYSKILVLSNDTVGKIYGDRVVKALEGRNVFYYEIKDGEEYKTIETAMEVYDKLIGWEFTRDSLIISLGGGVVCDLTGYIAATYMRGIEFVQIPTSLLSQVDASVGGKVAVNYKGKNLIGAFHQPKLVFIDHKVLDSLPLREIKTGIAETLKIALCFDEEFYEFLDNNSSDFLALKEETVKHAIKRACELKAKVVMEDEKENGIRALLNYGHTFGHVIEHMTEYVVYTHGEAVVLGMNFVNLLGEYLGICSKEYVEQCQRLFDKYELNYEIPKYDFDEMLKVLKRDKKNKEAKLKFVFSESLGKAHTKNVPVEELEKFYKELDGNTLRGVIDLGTNTCRLFVVEVKNGQIKTPYIKKVEIVTLGEDVNKTKMLKKEAIERTLACLKEYKAICDEMGVTEILAKATSAVRDSQNRDYFLELVKNETGISIDCISGEEEGTYTFSGTTIDIKNPILLIDIGGGSTEFIYGDSSKIEYIKSFDIGAVRIREKFFQNDDFTTNYVEAKKWIIENIKEIEFLKNKEFELVAVAGTATTQVSVKEKMLTYNPSLVHKYKLSLEDIKENINLFKSVDLEKRKEIVGLHPKRADVIIGGTYILETIMEMLNKETLIVSENDILDGIMISK